MRFNARSKRPGSEIDLTALWVNPIRKTLQVLHRFEDAALIAMFSAALGLALLQIVLRNGFDMGFLWLESLLKIQVLWLALQGAMIGAREAKHIRIDLLMRWLPTAIADALARALSLFSCLICGLGAYAGSELVEFERVDGLMAFGSVPIWLCQLILPLAFGVMAIRFGIQVMFPVSEVRHG
jgi:TRAP-type C4-dicarboxylate transport system permease small subunit